MPLRVVLATRKSGANRHRARAAQMARRLHPGRTMEDSPMNFATAADRVRSDFTEMPGLELTIGQAVRLWNIGADDCRYVLDALVDAGFLQWTPKRTIVRADTYAYISVRRSGRSDISSQGS
jgi:hypothetical protein